MLNIVLPMAGRGSRFANAGYTLPKPLIPVHGVPMIKVVVDNLTPKCEHRFIFVVQQAHIDQYDLVPKLKSYAKNVEIIGINGITEGQVCTALLAQKFFDNDEPLMNANSDQYIDIDINEYLDAMNERDLVRAANQMIADDIRVNGEFYTCPAYNYLIKEGKKIGIYGIGEEYNGMYGLGIPKDLEFFLQHPVSQHIKMKVMK